jgi:8-oxo-dGTP pyrophosphatase MutT (NUDIX family)
MVCRVSDLDWLLIERTDNGLWALHGGARDLSESVVEAAQREETGIEAEVTGPERDLL